MSVTRRLRRTSRTSPRWVRGRPRCSSAWRRPPTFRPQWALGLADGLAAEAARAGAAVVGGDVVAGAEVVVAVTALGSLDGRAPVTRSGASPGDVVAVTGGSAGRPRASQC